MKLAEHMQLRWRDLQVRATKNGWPDANQLASDMLAHIQALTAALSLQSVTDALNAVQAMRTTLNLGTPPTAPTSNTSTNSSHVTPARDPNVKYGPEGTVLSGQKLGYRVEFENEGEGIAFGVYFTDTLDEDLDDSSLEIGPVISTSDGSEIAPPGTYDPETRTITWLVGEVGPHEGGYADLSVSVRSDAPEGTEIINFGIVYFPSVPEVTRTNAIVNLIPYAKGAVRVLEKDGDNLTIEWEPFGDGQYIVQTTTDLASDVWEDAPGEWPTTARWHVLDAAGAKHLFIRVKTGGQ